MCKLSVLKSWIISFLDWSKNSSSILNASLKLFLSDSHSLEQMRGWMLILWFWVFMLLWPEAPFDADFENFKDCAFAWLDSLDFAAFFEAELSEMTNFGKLSAIFTKSISYSVQEVLISIRLKMESRTKMVYFHLFFLSSLLCRDRNKFWFCFRFCKLALFWFRCPMCFAGADFGFNSAIDDGSSISPSSFSILIEF